MVVGMNHIMLKFADNFVLYPDLNCFSRAFTMTLKHLITLKIYIGLFFCKWQKGKKGNESKEMKTMSRFLIFVMLSFDTCQKTWKLNFLRENRGTNYYKLRMAIISNLSAINKVQDLFFTSSDKENFTDELLCLNTTR